MLSTCVLGLCLIANAFDQQIVTNTGKDVKVLKGEYLHFAVTSLIDPNTAKVGDMVTLHLIRPLILDNIELLPRGETMIATVTKVRKPNPNCASGEVGLKFDQVTFHDGSSVPVKLVFRGNRAGFDPDFRRPAPKTAGEKAGVVSENIILDPIIGVGLLELGAVRLVTAPFKHNECSRFTQDHPMPAGAVIVVQTKKEHRARY